MPSPTAIKLIDFLANFAKAKDEVINAIQAKFDAAVTDKEAYKAEIAGLRTQIDTLNANAELAVTVEAGYKTEIAALRDRVSILEEALTDAEAFSAELQEIIDEFTPDAVPSPVEPVEPTVPVEVPEEVEVVAGTNDPSNPTQTVDELIEAVGELPAVDTSAVDTSTVGTTAPTPPETLDAVLGAVAEAIDAETAAPAPAETPAPATVEDPAPVVSFSGGEAVAPAE